ncbi:MAG: ABC transporter ATP-binding protein [Alphaproteobacteria bacterium]|nr:ABC transporter ATP-binding protein [Alphaproteobacteria bacterium]
MLKVKDLHAYYGKSHILQGVSFEVGKGEIVSLLGRNGVGRSTTVNAIMGDVDCKGSILFNGEEILGLDSHQIARKGLGIVLENRDVFPALTVRENLILGIKDMSKTGRWKIDDMFDMFPNLARRADVEAGALSGGEQQMLAMCRALMGDPDLIMVDEPTEGLAPKVVDQVANLLTEIANRGVSILLIEQKLTIALKISARIYVMGHGSVVYEGTSAEFEKNDQIRKDWLEV